MAIVEIMTNGSGYIDNPKYIEWMFTWQLQPKWRAKLEHYLPDETIALRVNSVPPKSPGSSGFDNNPFGDIVNETIALRVNSVPPKSTEAYGFDNPWDEIAKRAEIESLLWSEVSAQLQNNSPSDFEDLNFLSKLGALKAVSDMRVYFVFQLLFI